MHAIAIPKKSGGVRHIVAPNKEEKGRLRAMLPELHKTKLNACVHGFAILRSPVTNARQHIGYDVTVSFDLADFFDSVQPELHLKGKVAKPLYEACLYEGHTAQGLPTSPILSNIAASKLDEAVQKYLSKVAYATVYTRYADDLTISFRGRIPKKFLRKFKKDMKGIVANQRFKVNPKKTRTQFAACGRRIICGISVGQHTARPTRSTKRRLRWLTRQAFIRPDPQAHATHRGLSEWSLMKLPSKKPTRAEIRAMSKTNKSMDKRLVEAANRMLAAYNRAPRMRPVPKDIPETTEVIGGKTYVITNDPMMFAGMSLLGNSWSSCMNIASSHDCSAGTAFLQQIGGVSIAYLQASDTKMVEGVSKRLPCMAARALVYKTPEGRLFYGRIYPGENNSSAAALKTWLEAKGYSDRYTGRSKSKEIRLSGYAELNVHRPYFDVGTAADEKVNGKTVMAMYI